METLLKSLRLAYSYAKKLEQYNEAETNHASTIKEAIDHFEMQKRGKDEDTEIHFCPTCSAPCKISWSGLELVANTGDESLASKHYHFDQSVSFDERDGEKI